jgi:S-adenosylmethionine:tRNA ribosyltransferase-isomerase
LLVSEFDFDLPEELIAQTAAARGHSRLLVLNRHADSLQHTEISELPNLLEPGDVLVVNNTRVFAARLLGKRLPSGGSVECLLLSPVDAGGDGDDGLWDALVHPGQKLKPGALVRFEGPAGSLVAEIIERRFFGRRLLRLRAESGGNVEELIDGLGHVPLPPYIKRADAESDRDRYQTVYARVRGSVAAPTAGLHFTREMLEALDSRGVQRVEITLHVGYGTFKPVRADVVEEHTVDAEHYEISSRAAAAIDRARREGRRVIAVGTTTTRALEDAARHNDGELAPAKRAATTFIYPGFEFGVIDGLLTNFHLPRSSLLMLVCAFAGRERVLAAYREAIARRYRFYSYGDAMLIL